MRDVTRARVAIGRARARLGVIGTSVFEEEQRGATSEGREPWGWVESVYFAFVTLSSIGQMLISLTVGATRQAGGYQPALRLLLGGVLLSLPLTVCVQRAIDESSRLTSRAQEPDHQLLIEVEEVQELVPVGVARMDSSIHYGPARASAKLFMVPKRSNSLGY